MVRQPCPSCPWRVDQAATDIPGFDLELAEHLAGTSDGEFGSPIFACHQSREDEEFACAGWLAVEGYHSIAVRLMVMGGRLDAEALMPGEEWPALHQSFDELIEKLRETDDA